MQFVKEQCTYSMNSQQFTYRIERIAFHFHRVPPAPHENQRLLSELRKLQQAQLVVGKEATGMMNRITFNLWVARSRLYRRRFLQVNSKYM